MPDFMWMLGIRTQLLTFEPQTLLPTEHPPPNFWFACQWRDNIWSQAAIPTMGDVKPQIQMALVDKQNTEGYLLS